MPDRIISATTTTWASPPRIWPTRVSEKFTRRRVMPPLFMNSPASMKNGIAISSKEFTPTNMRCGKTTSGTDPSISSTSKLAKPIPWATGIPKLGEDEGCQHQDGQVHGFASCGRAARRVRRMLTIMRRPPTGIASVANPTGGPPNGDCCRIETRVRDQPYQTKRSSTIPTQRIPLTMSEPVIDPRGKPTDEEVERDMGSVAFCHARADEDHPHKQVAGDLFSPGDGVPESVAGNHLRKAQQREPDEHDRQAPLDAPVEPSPQTLLAGPLCYFAIHLPALALRSPSTLARGAYPPRCTADRPSRLDLRAERTRSPYAPEATSRPARLTDRGAGELDPPGSLVTESLESAG